MYDKFVYAHCKIAHTVHIVNKVNRLQRSFVSCSTLFCFRLNIFWLSALIWSLWFLTNKLFLCNWTAATIFSCSCLQICLLIRLHLMDCISRVGPFRFAVQTIKFVQTMPLLRSRHPIVFTMKKKTPNIYYIFPYARICTRKIPRFCCMNAIYYNMVGWLVGESPPNIYIHK